MIIWLPLVDDNRNPFKGPFKGKGENRRALRELESEMSEIDAAMREVVDRFNEAFRSPRPVHLRILAKRSYRLLWWRVPGNSGTYIRLFDSERGREILDALLPRTKKLLVDFDKERIRLNFRSSVVGNAIEGYRRRERDLDILERFERDELRD